MNTGCLKSNSLSWILQGATKLVFIPVYCLKLGTFCMYYQTEITTLSISVFKGTVIEIVCDPLCKDDNAWFITEPWKAFSGKVWISIDQIEV